MLSNVLSVVLRDYFTPFIPDIRMHSRNHKWQMLTQGPNTPQRWIQSRSLRMHLKAVWDTCVHILFIVLWWIQ